MSKNHRGPKFAEELLKNAKDPGVQMALKRGLGYIMEEAPKPEKGPKASIRMPKARKKSKPEQEYEAILAQEFCGSGVTVRYEPFALRLNSGARYSPDLVVFRGNEILCACEVKGGYRLQSAGRSYLAFKSAVAEYPDWPWRFAEKRDGQWIVTKPDAHQS